MIVIKRDNTKEEFNPDKIHEKVTFACEGVNNVSISEIEMNANSFLGQKEVKSSDIQKALIMSAAEMISEQTPNYEIVASRLLNQQLRKEVYNQYQPKPFLDQIKKNVNLKLYDKSILEKFTEQQIEYFGSKINYDKDNQLTYVALQQLYKKYLVQHKGLCVETPQEMYMLMSMFIFDNEKDIIDFYKLLANKQISLPTPICNGLRTPFKRFISCSVIDLGDTTNSISDGVASIMKMTASKAGIGVNAGKIRGLGANVGNGRVKHTGLLPILKTIEKATKSFTQLSRGGSSNITYPFYHIEIESVFPLGNAKGTETTRVRHCDHTIIFNKFFLERALQNKKIKLFYMNDVKDLWNLMGNYEKFKELYEKYEKSKPGKVVNAFDILSQFISERFLQGRLYCTFADNVDRGPFKQNDYITNLCCEILLKQKPLDGSEGNPEIASCILAGINHGYINDNKIPRACELIVKFLDNLIDYMTYGSEHIEYSTINRRALGIGHSDLFHFLAKNKVFYNTKEGRELIHDRIEMTAFYITKASIELAKERGACNLVQDTKYSEGWLPIDSCVESTKEFELKQDWESLRQDLKEFGIRNSTLMANAPFGNCISKDQRIQTQEGNLNLYDILKRENLNLNISNLKEGWIDLKTPLHLSTKDGDSISERFYINGNSEVYEIELENGDIIKCTGNHGFFSNNKFVLAKDLKINDTLELKDNSKIK